jgi:hypothetical protein
MPCPFQDSNRSPQFNAKFLVQRFVQKPPGNTV